MTTTPAPLTRDIGEAERSLRALLERELDGTGLSFAQWTAHVFLAGAGPLPEGELIGRLLAGRVAPEADARTAVDGLRAAGLVAATGEHGDGALALTSAGEAVFAPLRGAVAAITEDLHRDLPTADVDAARRTLAEIARRANRALAATGG
jgi:hypothetical protein